MTSHTSLANHTTSFGTVITSTEAERVAFHNNGYCPYHPDIQLRKRGKIFRRWKTILRECPRCASEFLVQQLVQLQSNAGSQAPVSVIEHRQNGLREDRSQASSITSPHLQSSRALPPVLQRHDSVSTNNDDYVDCWEDNPFLTPPTKQRENPSVEKDVSARSMNGSCQELMETTSHLDVTSDTQEDSMRSIVSQQSVKANKPSPPVSRESSSSSSECFATSSETGGFPVWDSSLLIQKSFETIPEMAESREEKKDVTNQSMGLLLQAAALSVLVRAAQTTPTSSTTQRQHPLRRKDVRMIRPVDLSTEATEIKTSRQDQNSEGNFDYDATKGSVGSSEQLVRNAHTSLAGVTKAASSPILAPKENAEECPKRVTRDPDGEAYSAVLAAPVDEISNTLLTRTACTDSSDSMAPTLESKTDGHNEAFSLATSEPEPNSNHLPTLCTKEPAEVSKFSVTNLETPSRCEDQIVSQRGLSGIMDEIIEGALNVVKCASPETQMTMSKAADGQGGEGTEHQEKQNDVTSPAVLSSANGMDTSIAADAQPTGSENGDLESAFNANQVQCPISDHITGTSASGSAPPIDARSTLAENQQIAAVKCAKLDTLRQESVFDRAPLDNALITPPSTQHVTSETPVMTTQVDENPKEPQDMNDKERTTKSVTVELSTCPEHFDCAAFISGQEEQKYVVSSDKKPNEGLDNLSESAPLQDEEESVDNEIGQSTTAENEVEVIRSTNDMWANEFVAVVPRQHSDVEQNCLLSVLDPTGTQPRGKEQFESEKTGGSYGDGQVDCAKILPAVDDSSGIDRDVSSFSGRALCLAESSPDEERLLMFCKTEDQYLLEEEFSFDGKTSQESKTDSTKKFTDDLTQSPDEENPSVFDNLSPSLPAALPFGDKLTDLKETPGILYKCELQSSSNTEGCNKISSDDENAAILSKQAITSSQERPLVVNNKENPKLLATKTQVAEGDNNSPPIVTNKCGIDTQDVRRLADDVITSSEAPLMEPLNSCHEESIEEFVKSESKSVVSCWEDPEGSRANRVTQLVAAPIRVAAAMEADGGLKSNEIEDDPKTTGCASVSDLGLTMDSEDTLSESDKFQTNTAAGSAQPNLDARTDNVILPATFDADQPTQDGVGTVGVDMVDTDESLEVDIQRNVDLCRIIRLEEESGGFKQKSDVEEVTSSFDEFDEAPPSPVCSIRETPSHDTSEHSQFASTFSAFEGARSRKLNPTQDPTRLTVCCSTDDTLDSVLDGIDEGNENEEQVQRTFELHESHSVVFIPPLEGNDEEAKVLETRQFRNGSFEKTEFSETYEVVQDIKQHVHDASKLKQIFRRVLSLVGNNNVRNKIVFVDEGGIESVLLVMNWHSTEAMLQELGCAISLSVMSNNDSIVETFVESGGIASLVKAMKRFPKHSGIQEQGCGTMWNLLASKAVDAKIGFGKVGGVSCLIAALQNMDQNESVVEQACGASWNLISGGTSEPRNEFAEKGGMECLIKVMSANKDHERIQEYACGAALRLMACNEDSVNVFAEHGGIDAIMAAMESFNDKPAVLLQAYGAAWHFMRDNGTRTAVFADESIDDSEGIECVIEVMKENEFCCDIDEADVRKGRITVSVSNDRRDMFASAGGLLWLIDSLQHYTLTNVRLLEQCLRTSIHLISDSTTYKSAFARAGGVQHVVDGMQQHPSDKVIQQLGCEVLLSLSVVDDIFSGLNACDVLSVLQAARGSFSSEYSE